MLLGLAVVVDDVELVEVIRMTPWFEVELCGFVNITLLGFYTVKVIDSPIEDFLVNYTTDQERSVSIIISCTCSDITKQIKIYRFLKTGNYTVIMYVNLLNKSKGGIS